MISCAVCFNLFVGLFRYICIYVYAIITHIGLWTWDEITTTSSSWLLNDITANYYFDMLLLTSSKHTINKANINGVKYHYIVLQIQTNLCIVQSAISTYLIGCTLCAFLRDQNSLITSHAIIDDVFAYKLLSMNT